MKEMLYEVRCLKSNEDIILALAGQYLSNCLMDLKNSGDSTGFEPMTSAMPVQYSNQLGYEFFRSMRQLLKLSSKCEDHIFFFFIFFI